LPHSKHCDGVQQTGDGLILAACSEHLDS